MSGDGPEKGARGRPAGELFALYVADGMLYDKLNRFAAEYSVPVDALTELAVSRFVNDVELFRKLRIGKPGGD